MTSSLSCQPLLAVCAATVNTARTAHRKQTRADVSDDEDETRSRSLCCGDAVNLWREAARHPALLAFIQLPVASWLIPQSAMLYPPDADADEMVTPATLIWQLTLPLPWSWALIT